MTHIFPRVRFFVDIITLKCVKSLNGLFARRVVVEMALLRRVSALFWCFRSRRSWLTRMAELLPTHAVAPQSLWSPADYTSAREYSISFCARIFKMRLDFFSFKLRWGAKNAFSLPSTSLKWTSQVGDQWNVSKTKQSMKKLTRASPRPRVNAGDS